MRPPAYHRPSPMKQAANATPNTAAGESWPPAASAPATISVGTAGTGRPACSTSTLMKISSKPWRATRSISSCMTELPPPQASLVAYVDDLVALDAAGGLHVDDLAGFLADERLADGRGV